VSRAFGYLSFHSHNYDSDSPDELFDGPCRGDVGKILRFFIDKKIKVHISEDKVHIY
jgi:hypothetical protein